METFFGFKKPRRYEIQVNYTAIMPDVPEIEESDEEEEEEEEEEGEAKEGEDWMQTVPCST